jgi:hypothetical protein
MSFVTWLALPVAITLVASLIMALLSRRPRTDTHQDIENFARFRGALARQTAAPAPPPEPASPADLSSSQRAEPSADAVERAGQSVPADPVVPAAPEAASNATAGHDRQRPARTGVAASSER